MANRSHIGETTNRKRSKQEMAARLSEEEAWRAGSLKDYEPVSLDSDGMVAYERIARAIPADKIAEVDGYTIERAAANLADVQHIESLIANIGLSEAIQGGKLWAAKHKSEEQARKWLIELGCSPSARAKIASDVAASIAKPKTIRELMAEDE